MKVKFKRLEAEAKAPTKAHKSDAGYDIVATRRYFDEIGKVVYGTGIAVEIPEGYVGLLFPRSSVCCYDLSPNNCIGVIDSGYRGEIMFKFRPTLLYCDNISIHRGHGRHARDYAGSLQIDPATQSVMANGLDSTFFGSFPTYPSGRATTAINEEGRTKLLSTLDPRLYEVGDRVGQLLILPIPQIEFEESDELSPSDRGVGGYGSTGK